MAGQCPPNLVRRMFSRTTTQALREHRAHEHRGAHPYRVILGEVRRRLINTRRRMEEMLAGQQVRKGGVVPWGVSGSQWREAAVRV